MIHSPLPVFRRPPSIERDTTIMRPRDPDRIVLTVEAPRKYLEPDSPNSLDQLISPDGEQLMQKKPNLRASAESIDELLKHEQTGTELSGKDVLGQNPFSYQRVFDYEVTPEHVPYVASRAPGAVNLGGADGELVEAGAGDMYFSGRGYIAQQEEKCSSLLNGTDTAFCVDESVGDSGKSSLENMSQTDSGSLLCHLSSGEKNPPPNSKHQPGIICGSPTSNGSTATVAGSWVVLQDSGTSVQKKSVAPTPPNHCYQNAASPLPVGLLSQSVDRVSSSQCTDSAQSVSPWEPRCLGTPPHAPTGSSQGDPNYVNIAMANTPARPRPDMSHRSDLSQNACQGNGGPIQTSIYPSGIQTASEIQRDEEAGRDPGDSGVVTDLTTTKGTSRSGNKSPTWL